MVGLGIYRLKSLCSCINPSLKLHSISPIINSSSFANHSLFRSSYAFVNQEYCKKEFKRIENFATAHPNILSSRAKSVFSTTSPIPYISVSTMLGYRSLSSSSGGNVDKSGAFEVSSATRGSNIEVGNNDDVGIDWIDKVKDAWQRAMDAMTSIGQKTKEVSDELIPYSQQLLDSHPYLKSVIVPVGYTFIGTLLAWMVMPKILRMCHKYSTRTPAALLARSLSGEPVSYEKSFWGALEDPVRYLVTFIAFLKIATIAAPTTMASQYIEQGWRGAVVLSFVWFLYRWKSNVFSRAMTAQTLALPDRERMLALDKISSIGLFLIGAMALSEACGVAVQSILTVGGIGGVATAFAARDVLGNVLSGFSIQFSRPFSLGDIIKAGSVEGQVIEMGLTNTVLLNAEKFPVSVPNSLFFSQVIENKSRVQWRAIVTKIPFRIDDLDKIPQVSDGIKSWLKSNPKVFLEKEPPYCFLSGIESCFAELTIECNLKYMVSSPALQSLFYGALAFIYQSKYEFYSTKQDILLQSARILKEHGAELGSAWQDIPTE